MRRQRGADARVVRHHFVALVNQPLVPDNFQQVPSRLDVVVVERVVSVAEVDPVTHAPRHLLPFADVSHHRLAATAGEFRDADLLLDCLFVEYAEFFFNLMFDRQTVRIPAAFARRVVAAHGFETRINVFERARQHMMNAGLAVGRGGAFVETETRPPATLLDGPVENRARFPERQHRLLQRRPVVPTVDRLERRGRRLAFILAHARPHRATPMNANASTMPLMRPMVCAVLATLKSNNASKIPDQHNANQPSNR